MSSTLNRKQSGSAPSGERRNSEDYLSSGTLRRAAAIPVMEEDNAISPLKQLQRANQVGTFPRMPKSRAGGPVPFHSRSNSGDKSEKSSTGGDTLKQDHMCNNNDITNDPSQDYNDNEYQAHSIAKSDTNGNMADIQYSSDVPRSGTPSCDISKPEVLVTTPSAGYTSPQIKRPEEKCMLPPQGKRNSVSSVVLKDEICSSDSSNTDSGEKLVSTFKDTEKSFCPLALDLHPHSHMDYMYHKPGCSPETKPDPEPQIQVTTQQVTVEVHRTESQETLNSNKNSDNSDSGVNSELHNQNSMTSSQETNQGQNDVQGHSNREQGQSLYEGHACEPMEGPRIVVQSESDYDVPRSLSIFRLPVALRSPTELTSTNAPSPTVLVSPMVTSPTSLTSPTTLKSPTSPSASPIRQSNRRIERPKCRAPPPPTSTRTVSIRDSLCSSSSTHSVNSSASSHSGYSKAGSNMSADSANSHSSGISSSGSALSQCSQSTITSDGERDITKTPTRGLSRPKGPAPPPPPNAKPYRPPPLALNQERAASEPKEALGVRSPQEHRSPRTPRVVSHYDVPPKLPTYRPPSITAPPRTSSISSHADLEKRQELMSSLSRNVEVRRSTLGTTGEIKVTPIPRETQQQISSFLPPMTKPVIEVKLVKHDRQQSPKPANKIIPSTEEMNTINKARMTRSAENLDQKYVELIELGPPRPISPTVRNSFMGSDVEIPRESVYNSIGEMNTLLKTGASESEKIYSLPQPQCYGDDTLKAVKTITEKYDTLERHRQRAVSFRENSKSSTSGAKSEPTSPMIAIQEVSASDPQLTDVCDYVFTEPSTIEMPRTDDTKVKDITDIPGSPDKIMDMEYGGINARDISRIDLFYRGQGTEVVVCTCMASLSLGLPTATSDLIETWEGPLHVGVPVLVLNTGSGKRNRELFIVVAERETGFPLWQDKVSYLTNYQQMSPLVHVLQPSTNMRQKIGITFMQEQAAQEFFDKFGEITANPNDELWKISAGKQEKKHRRLSFRKKKTSKKDYNKTEISKPCNFTHLTNIDPKDRRMVQELKAHDYVCPGSSSELAKHRLKTKTM